MRCTRARTSAPTSSMKSGRSRRRGWSIPSPTSCSSSPRSRCCSPRAAAKRGTPGRSTKLPSRRRGGRFSGRIRAWCPSRACCCWCRASRRSSRAPTPGERASCSRKRKRSRYERRRPPRAADADRDDRRHLHRRADLLHAALSRAHLRLLLARESGVRPRLFPDHRHDEGGAARCGAALHLHGLHHRAGGPDGAIVLGAAHGARAGARLALHSGDPDLDVFAMATGIFGAAVTVLGIMAGPIMIKTGYDAKLSAGAITAGGTLGILIPPSVMLIVMGPVLGVSVADLYAAAFGPGFLLASIYLIYLITRSMINPKLGPPVPKEERVTDPVAIVKEVMIGVLPLALLIAATLGSILAGLATPTEAAGIGALGALILAVVYRRLTYAGLKQAVISATTTSSMVLLLAVTSNIF